MFFDTKNAHKCYWILSTLDGLCLIDMDILLENEDFVLLLKKVVNQNKTIEDSVNELMEFVKNNF